MYCRFGGGSSRYLKKKVQELAARHSLGITSEFCTHTPNVDQELAAHKIFVMSGVLRGLICLFWRPWLLVVWLLAVMRWVCVRAELIRDGDDGFCV